MSSRSAIKTVLALLLCISWSDASTRISSTSPSVLKSSPSTASTALDDPGVPFNSIVCTEAAHLASDFEKALVAVNQQREDIHVGNLLSACTSLEATMRRIGFVQGASDIASNVQKIRIVYQQVPPDQRDSMPALLQYELNTLGDAAAGKKRPAFKDSSATMGFLWLGRSLNYQYDMFQQLLLDGSCQPYEAACCAYERNMKPHLSWAVQQVCQVALKKLKALRRENILAGIGGFSEASYGTYEDEATRNDLNKVMRCLEPMLGRWKQVFSEMGLGDI